MECAGKRAGRETTTTTTTTASTAAAETTTMPPLIAPEVIDSDYGDDDDDEQQQVVVVFVRNRKIFVFVFVAIFVALVSLLVIVARSLARCWLTGSSFVQISRRSGCLVVVNLLVSQSSPSSIVNIQITRVR